MQRVDEEIEKAEGKNGKRTQRRIREEPLVEMMCVCNQVPKGLLIDFYDAAWFNNCTPGQKVGLADTGNVAFLPDASDSIRGNQDPDKKLNSKNFTHKYWDLKIQQYDLSHEHGKESEAWESNTDRNEDSNDVGYLVDEDGDLLEDDEVGSDVNMAHVGDTSFFEVRSNTAWEGW
ncbi:hypothetical protein O181_077607 [Austropuccinia psidii MF-1]|uniref:Uncharacterized protein n=1 Tax=Austropuccinia psidii MF-1 TaxID=1389203 RepID=A0A9Q3FG97_9BASI|nr:hypothetical protein [Austropuccinia psidii MF-1]